MFSNRTGIVYESISTVPVVPPLRAILSALLSSGVVVNLYTAFALQRTKINSLLTKLLLYQQNLLDSLFAILTISLIFTNNYRPKSNSIPVDWVTCYVFQSGVLSRIVRIATICNSVCQSADRFWAIIYPKTYRVYKRRYIVLCSLIIPIYSILTSITRMVKVTLINGSCMKKDVQINKYTSWVLESMLRYVIPIFVLSLLNVLVIRKLYEQKAVILKQTHSQSGTQDCSHVICEQGGNGSISGPLNSVQKNIFLNTFFLAVGLTLVEIASSVLAVMSMFNMVEHSVSSLSRVYYLVAVVLLSGLNRCVEILTIPMLRNTVLIHWRMCISFCRKN
ncbi:hypothetical protein FBUS_07852 [Fasciolopsis buskii]|uniref:G-protein coupled receptors family 1 profile domain-containing protein n=1 Tax=Fasciolopsis buskii TaxID=27845 RepID=A0A8E0S1V9_9TREM|nr:hypothetical protein FBUS_07852 [Fasciolopsis buski]